MASDDDLTQWMRGGREECLIVPVDEINPHVALGYVLETETGEGALLRPPANERRRVTRLQDDIAMLERVADICGKCIWPEDENATVPFDTLRELEREVTARMQVPAEVWLVRREAVWMIQAAQEIHSAREAKQRMLVDRWTRMAEMLRSAIALDLHQVNSAIARA